MHYFSQEKYSDGFAKIWQFSKVTASFFVTYVYMLLVSPHLWQVLQVELALVILLFWFHRKQSVSLLAAWLVGSLVDVLFGYTLGVHAFLYVACLYVMQLLYVQFSRSTLFVQCILVMVILMTEAVVRLLLLQATDLLLSAYSLTLLVRGMVGAVVWSCFVVICKK